MRGLGACLLGTVASMACGNALAFDRESFVALAPSVMKIEVQRAQGGYALGSGVAVAAEKVVTNCHVTREGEKIFVLRGGVRWPVDAQASDPEHDLCLLSVPKLDAVAVSLGQSARLAVAQSVTALGYTGGLGLQSSAGEVVALHTLDGGRVVQSTNWFTSGASGGGLFDDKARLIAILTFRLRGGEAHYFASPVEWLSRLLEHPNFQPVAPLPRDALPFWQVALPLQPPFLQAGVMERDQQWAELETLASRWTQLDAKDPQAWYAQSLAFDAQGRWADARQSIERSLSLEPKFAAGWLTLGLVALRQGQPERARQARAKLQDLHSDLSTDLERALNAP